MLFLHHMSIKASLRKYDKLDIYLLLSLRELVLFFFLTSVIFIWVFSLLKGLRISFKTPPPHHWKTNIFLQIMFKILFASSNYANPKAKLKKFKWFKSDASVMTKREKSKTWAKYVQSMPVISVDSITLSVPPPKSRCFPSTVCLILIGLCS